MQEDPNSIPPSQRRQHLKEINFFFWKKHKRFRVVTSLSPPCCCAEMALWSSHKAGHHLARLQSSLQGCEHCLPFKAKGEKQEAQHRSQWMRRWLSAAGGWSAPSAPSPSPDPFGSSGHVSQLPALCPPPCLLCLQFCSCGPIPCAPRCCKPRRGGWVVLRETRCLRFRADAERPSGLPRLTAASSHLAPAPWNYKPQQEQGPPVTVLRHLMQEGQKLRGPTLQEVGKDSLRAGSTQGWYKRGRQTLRETTLRLRSGRTASA